LSILDIMQRTNIVMRALMRRRIDTTLVWSSPRRPQSATSAALKPNWSESNVLQSANVIDINAADHIFKEELSEIPVSPTLKSTSSMPAKGPENLLGEGSFEKTEAVAFNKFSKDEGDILIGTSSGSGAEDDNIGQNDAVNYDKQDKQRSMGRQHPSKSKVFALWVMYKGSSFQGSAYQGRNPTVERELLRGVLRAGLRKDLLYGAINSPDVFKLMMLRHASRTDKGVHSVSNVMSLPLDTEELSNDAVIARLNAKMHPSLRIAACHRTTRSFRGRYEASEREYTFILPSWLFSYTSPDSENATREFRIEERTLEWIGQRLEWFTSEQHNFHNFCSRLSQFDRRVYQKLLDFRVSRVFKWEDDGTEFLEFSILSNSFLNSQIRKIIAYLVCSFRGTLPQDGIGFRKMTGISKFRLPISPSDPLVLRGLSFNRYNKKFEQYPELYSHLEQIPSDLGIVARDDFYENVLTPHICGGSRETWRWWLEYLQTTAADNEFCWGDPVPPQHWPEVPPINQCHLPDYLKDHFGVSNRVQIWDKLVALQRSIRNQTKVGVLEQTEKEEIIFTEQNL